MLYTGCWMLDDPEGSRRMVQSVGCKAHDGCRMLGTGFWKLGAVSARC